MASQVVSSTSQLEVFEMSIIYVRGYHGYMDIWTTVIGEVLLVKERQTTFMMSILCIGVGMRF